MERSAAPKSWGGGETLQCKLQGRAAQPPTTRRPRIGWKPSLNTNQLQLWAMQVAHLLKPGPVPPTKRRWGWPLGVEKPIVIVGCCSSLLPMSGPMPPVELKHVPDGLWSRQSWSISRAHVTPCICTITLPNKNLKAYQSSQNGYYSRQQSTCLPQTALDSSTEGRPTTLPPFSFSKWRCAVRNQTLHFWATQRTKNTDSAIGPNRCTSWYVWFYTRRGVSKNLWSAFHSVHKKDEQGRYSKRKNLKITSVKMEITAEVKPRCN